MELVKSISITALLAQRDAFVQRVTEAHRLLQESLEIERTVFSGKEGKAGRHYRTLAMECVFDRSHRFTEPDGLAHFITAHDASLWALLMDESGLRTFMDATARRKWDEDITKGNVPALTRENINATFAALYADRQGMFENGVLAVFRGLSWDYKTNCPVKFGKRIIDTRVVSRYGAIFMGVSHDGAARLDDLLRVMLVMDGKPEPDHREGAFHALTKAKWPEVSNTAELHGMVSIRGFKNGNAHITFLRPDLVDKLNVIVAKHFPNALPPASECAK
jgi:hypothetical protein